MGQTLSWTNPSFEGTAPGSSISPPNWAGCQGSPDTQPGCWGVTLTPAQGVSFLGLVFLVSSPGTQESAGQTLPVAMVGGSTYSMSLRLANLAIYDPNWNGGAIVNLYGGASNCAFTQLLWSSGNFTHSTWQQYNAIFTASSSWTRFIIRVHPGVATTWPSVGVDNMLSVILPAHLNNFSADLVETQGEINWQTSEEVNLESYTIERSGSDMDFHDIATVPATGANGGSQTYKFVDEDLPEGLSYYRLRMNDQNGTSTITEIRQLLYSTTGEHFVLKSIFPNPADVFARLDIFSLVDQQATVRVVDLAGRLIHEETMGLSAGENELEINTTNYRAGLYRVLLLAGGKVANKSLVVAH